MIIYKNCSEVSLHLVYSAFQIGFSDYIIKLDISQEGFERHFIGQEGNDLGHSFIALDGEEPVGVILGGIKMFDGVKTMRCGALCIHPDYRGQGISRALFELHKQTAVEQGCKQLFLEVIVGNDRAINFYKRLGYQKIYDINYYSLPDVQNLKEVKPDMFGIRKMEYTSLESLLCRVEDIHINWQNDFDYMKKIEGLLYFGAFDHSELIGALAISASGKIFFLYVLPKYRQKGLATQLLAYAVAGLNLEKLSISFTNNSKLEGFVKHNHFVKDSITQNEMYLYL